MLTRIATLQLSVSFGLSMFHTIFNVSTVLIVLPLTGLLVKLVTKIVPDKRLPRISKTNPVSASSKFIC